MASNPLPPNTNPTFVADYPLATTYPSHVTNYVAVFKRPSTIKGIVLHTPEEDADDTEVTPVYFAGANRQASVNYYGDNDGDVIQCVSESWMPFANGVVGKPYPAWADPNVNLNWQTVSIEIEGRANTIQDTMPIGGDQWNGLVKLIRNRCEFHGIPKDREHIIGHYQVSNERSDPGPLFPWDALIAAVQEEELTDEEKRKLDDRDGRVQMGNLLSHWYNLSTDRQANTITIYDPVSGLVKAVIQDVPEWVPT